MLNAERPQDFELIELLIKEGVTGTPAEEFKSFKARFQSYVNQIPSYLHSVNKEEFFSHFFFGGFSTLLDTQIGEKLKIDKIYFRFSEKETLKVAVIKKDEINCANAVDKIKLFSISKRGASHQEFDSGNLDNILSKLNLPGPVISRIKIEVQLKFKLVEISKSDTGNPIQVSVESKKVTEKKTNIDFHEIKKGLWQNPENYIERLTNVNGERVKETTEEIFRRISAIYSEYKGSFSYGYGPQGTIKEAAHHGFVAGIFAMNFHYRYNLRVYLEQFAGRGYGDIILLARGKERSLNSVPIIIELKAGAAKPNDGLEQAKGYAKGFQPNTMRVLTTSDNVLCVGLNLDFTQNEKFLTHLSPPRDRVPDLPTIQKLLEGLLDWDGTENTIAQAKERIKQPLERIYHTFPGTPEKRGNYFSRFLLGQLIHADEFRKVNLEKSIFLYDEYPLNLERRSGTKESDERPVTTFVLNRKGRSSEELFIFHVREGGRGERSDKRIPIDLPKVNKITEVYINVQEGTAPFNVEEIKRYNSVDQYKEGKKVFKGKLERVPYPNELKETFDRVLDSQRLLRPGQPTTPIQPTTINSQYQGLLEKIAEGIHPLRGFVKDESDFQGMLHGAFSYYSDLKLQEARETRALVLTEFQTGRGKRTDMLIHGIKFQDWGDAKEYVPIGLELKGPRDGVSIDALKQEGNNQVKSEYEKGVTYRTLTDGDEVGFIVVVFNKDARNADSLISISNDNLFKAKVCHSSVLIPNQNLQSLDLAGCLKQGNRKKRSTSMSCIDSRDEEKITKEEKEELIKELFDTDEMRREAKSIEFYDELFRISEGVCKGKIFDLKDFVMKIRNIDPGSIDSEVRGVVKEIKKKMSEEEIKNFLRKPEVSGKINKVAGDASVTYGKFSSNGKSESQNIIRKINSNTEVMNHLNRIGKISGWAMHGVMYKNLMGDIISGNAEGVAINLGFIAGNNVLGKLANAVAMRGERLVSDGKVFLGKSLKAASPFLARAATGFIIYDLVNQVKAYKAGDKDAMVGIVGDSIVITVDAVEIGIEVAEIAEILIGVSSVTGPIGAAVGVVVFIGTDVYLSVKTVERENEIIHLTGWEKFQEGWRAFLNIPPEKYIEKLIEEKLANNHLVDNAVDFLKQHTSINRYVFPTGRLVDRQRIKMDLDSVVLLDKKKKDIKWSRARPGNPKEGDFFCLPKGDYESVGGESYLCENAIGLSYSANRTGNYTLVDLGDGNDNVVGLKDIPHVFQVGDGRKTLTGGNKGDTFILYGNPINHTVLAGGDGDDTLDLTRLAWDVVELKNSSYDHYAELSNSGDSSSLLLLSSMETILGREKKQDIILCDRSFKYVDGKGGKNNQHLDKVTISHVPESGKLKVAVRPDTEIINFSGRGVFDYVAFCNKGKARVRLCSKGDQLQHNVLFNYTLSDFSNIETQQSSLNSSTEIKNVSFNFQQGFSDTFNISIESITTNVSYVLLGDSTRIRVGNGGNLYALQSTDRPISDIIRDYPTIANRLNLTIVTEFQDEFIVIGHGKHEVMNNEPLRDSHLIGNGGENVYVITPTQKKVNVYDVHEGVAINTLDLRNVIKNVYGTSAKVSQDGNDLLIELEGMESLLKFPVRIKNGVQWHQKLHVVLDSMPMRIKHSGSNWNLSLAPLAFDNSTKIAVITAKDVDEGSELTVHKQAGNYTFSRLRNDLLIITDLSSKEGNACTVLFSNFYEEPKMKTLSIKFDNKTISLQEEMERINSSELIFCPTLLQINKSLSINSNKLLDGYDCLRFGSDDIAFIKSGNNLLLLSNQGVLSILDYYSKAHEKWSLSVELNNSIIKPEEFRERADNPSSLRYYLPSGNGLQIYHNQPTNKYQIGLVDLRNESISDYNMEANNSSLVLRSRNNVIEVENWNIDPSARKMMFVFNDTTVANVKCIISSCSPENITGEFRKVASVNKRDEGGDAKIHRAVLLKDLAEVQSLLNIGAKIDAKNKFGKTSLHLAIEQDDFNMVKLLLNNNADVNAKDDYGNTPLQCIISRYFIPVSSGLKDEKFNMVKLLLDSDADIRAKDGNGRTPLHNIIIVSITNLSANDNEVSNLAQLFIDKDATILDEQDSRGDTPFRLAVLYRPNLQRYFIGKGAKANIQNNNGEAPYQRYKRFAEQLSSSTINSIEFVDRNAALRLAIKADDLNVVESLVKKIANVDVENNNGQTILDFAIKNGRLDVVQYLVGEGVDNDGKTLFEIAFKYNKTEIIRFFATVRDKYGYTALHYSAEEDNLYLSNLLLDNNADINAKNNDGWTPVQLGAKNNKLEMVKSLTNRGASINTKNNYGWTVLHYAYAFGTPDMVNFLIDNGADIDAKTNRGEMPLEIAREYGNLRVEDFFQRNKEIAPERRRHHIRHKRYYRGHRSRRLLVEEVESSPAKLFYFESTGTSDQHIITNETENSSQNDRIGYNKEKTTSGVSKPSSWVNTFVNTISDAVKGVYQLISSSPAIDMGRPQPSKAMTDQVTDVNGTLLLLDVFIRKITGKKYVSTADKPISPLEAQGYALNITEVFKKVIEQAGLKSGVSMHRLNIDFVEIQKEVTGKIMSGKFDEISGVLSSYLEKACPSREAGCLGKLSSKKFDKFMVEFNSRLNVVLNRSIQRILHNGDGRLEVDGAKQMNLEPQSYLSNASVQGHSKDKVSTCLSEIGVTKLGGNLNR